jgi:hypothetical protein
MTAAISEDDGQTWPHKILIDERAAVSYPDSVSDSNGNIYIIYDRDRGGAKEILLARITEDNIKAGSIVTGTSYTKRVINNNNGR